MPSAAKNKAKVAGSETFPDGGSTTSEYGLYNQTPASAVSVVVLVQCNKRIQLIDEVPFPEYARLEITVWLGNCGAWALLHNPCGQKVTGEIINSLSLPDGSKIPPVPHQNRAVITIVVNTEVHIHQERGSILVDQGDRDVTIAARIGRIRILKDPKLQTPYEIRAGWPFL